MPTETCALCTEEADPRKSHIIPNSVFSQLKRTSKSGQLIQFDGLDDTFVSRSQESWHERLMCEKCEGLISSYEKKGLELIRKTIRNPKNYYSDGLLFRTFDYPNVKLFLTSIIWRSAIAKGAVFSAVKMQEQLLEKSRYSLSHGLPLPENTLGCKISLLVDNTENGFSEQSLREVIVSPFIRYINVKKYSVLFLFEGFLFEFFIPSAPYKTFISKGFIRDKRSFFSPKISIHEIEEMSKLNASAYMKYINGKVKL